jgi:hypothetical protein
MHDLEALTPSLEALAAALRRRGGSIACWPRPAPTSPAPATGSTAAW